MARELIALEDFDKELKRLTKKYRTLIQDIRLLSTVLKEEAPVGVNLGGGLYKVRLGTASKGGAKVAVFVLLLTIQTHRP